MATINLGKVKGEPFRYEDFTQEQLNALKGKDFKYEDFSPEQLEKLKSKIEVGNVTTLDADEQVSVTPRVNGNTTTLDFAIPRGNGVNSYSGTRQEYEDIAHTIKDGSLVNITDEKDFEEENLLGTKVFEQLQNMETNLESNENRINDIEANMRNIKPHALTNPTNNLLATEAGTALDAVQGKVLNDKITAQEELDNIFLFTLNGSDKNIDKILSDAGIDFDLTFQENMGLLKKISANHDLKSISIFINSNSSTFNTSLPASNGGILEVHYPKYNRRIFKFYSYRTADVYVNYELDGTYGTWQKLLTENDLNSRYKIKTYNTFKSIGISSVNDVVDITTIFKKLPTHGILEMGVNMADREPFFNKGLIPKQNTGTIKFINLGRVRVEYYPEPGTEMYIKTSSNYDNQLTSYSPWHMFSGTEVI